MSFLKKEPSKGFKERRRQPRIYFESPEIFAVEFKESRFKSSQIGYGRDLSTIGVRFKCARPPKKGSRLSMTVYLTKQFPGKRKFEVEAETIRIIKANEPRVGCEFLHVSEEAKEILKQFIDWVHVTPGVDFLE